jgi:hypothetical protein
VQISHEGASSGASFHGHSSISSSSEYGGRTA